MRAAAADIDAANSVAAERKWVPRLAAHLPVAVPAPVASGAGTEAG